MDEQSFNGAVKRLEEIDQIVRRLDPSTRASAFATLSGYVAAPRAEAGDIEQLALLVLIQAARDAERDLKDMMRELAAINAAKAKLRELLERAARESEEIAHVLRCEYDELFVTTELSELESLRLQMAMDRRSKMLSTLSNILKKLSDTESTLVENLK